MSLSSRREESLRSEEDSSVLASLLSTRPRSVIEPRLSSRFETYSKGGIVAAEVPVLVIPPVATPGADDCLIEWTVNSPAYHRIRYRKVEDEEWNYTDWTDTPSVEAAITLSDLP